MKDSSNRKSSSVTLCILRFLTILLFFFLLGLEHLDEDKDEDVGAVFSSSTVLALTVPFGSLWVDHSKYFLNEGSGL